MARIWFYREMAPYSSLATPYVRLNGVIAGVSQPGGSSYRDVPPGHYHLSVDSYGVDFPDPHPQPPMQERDYGFD